MIRGGYDNWRAGATRFTTGRYFLCVIENSIALWRNRDKLLTDIVPFTSSRSNRVESKLGLAAGSSNRMRGCDML